VATTLIADTDSTSASAPPETGGARRSAALPLLVSAQFVVMLDTSIVNVALPNIQADLGLRPTAITWVVNAYVLALGGLLLLSGRAADLFGRRRMFVGGSVLFAVGTLLAASADGASPLVAGRIVQGIGAAALSPAALSLLMLTFPGSARARAMSVWGAASALGGATGVMAGGLLVSAFGWCSVFLVTLPVSVAAVILAGRVLPEGARGARRRFDWGGAVASTGSVVALVRGALGIADHGWTSPSVLVAFTVSGILFTVFIAVERCTVDPLLPLDLFRSGPLGTHVGLALLGGAARASTFVLIALYLQQALALAPRQAGLAMVPTSLTGFAFSLTLLPRIVRAVGPQRSLVAGLAVLAAGHLWLATVPATSSDYLTGVLPALVLVAIGVALSFTPTTMLMAGALPDAHAGLASGLAGSATQVGAAVGTAAFTAIGISAGGSVGGVLDASGFSAAFTAAAVVALATAAVGGTLAGARR
jgi:EmrB/QacA subfamily drug resistance transporter